MGAKNLKDLCLEEEEKTRVEKLDEIVDLEFNANKTAQIQIDEAAINTATHTNIHDISKMTGSNNLKILDTESFEESSFNSRLSKLESAMTYKVEVVSEVKLLDHKATQILQRMIQKNPESKKEALMIKKLIQELLKKIS